MAALCILPGTRPETEPGPQSMTDHETSKHGGKEEFVQIATAKKLPC